MFWIYLKQKYKLFFSSLSSIYSTVTTCIILSIVPLLFIATLFIPNAILVALKYRSGVLPSLRDRNFKKYRKSMTSLTFLMPVVFWSAFSVTFVLFFVLLLALFILAWGVSFSKLRQHILSLHSFADYILLCFDCTGDSCNCDRSDCTNYW